MCCQRGRAKQVPLQGNKRPGEVIWCADNGCFNESTFKEERWWAWLNKHKDAAGSCLFATAPDVVGDHAATMERSVPWLPQIRELGYPAAFVAQDGATSTTVPWDDFDAVFLGGTNDFKLSETAQEIVAEGLARKKHTHMGRVNSRRRLQLAHKWGCHSVDGTYLVFGPSINLPKLLGWLEELPNAGSLPGATTSGEKELLGWIDDIPQPNYSHRTSHSPWYKKSYK